MAGPAGAAPFAPPPLPAFDRRYALAMLFAVPPLAGVVLGLSLAGWPLAGWAVGLGLYWAVMGGALWAWADPDWLRDWLPARWPGWGVAVLLALPAMVLGAMVLRLLGQDPLPPHLLILAGLMAAANATLEELYWRGAMIPDPGPREAALSLGLFTAAHGIWVAALGLETGGPPWAALAGALALGGVWTAARLLTGTVGAGLLSHAAFNLFAFAQILALNT
jgi:membrane protease YdiL (CAAX protease family)